MFIVRSSLRSSLSAAAAVSVEIAVAEVTDNLVERFAQHVISNTRVKGMCKTKCKSLASTVFGWITRLGNSLSSIAADADDGVVALGWGEICSTALH